MQQDRELGHIESIRALAALSVAAFHFIHFDPAFVANETVKHLAIYGAQGVEIFYVISGFILPYALYKTGYVLRNYSTFLYKRFVRLFPPYVATIVGIIVVDMLLSRFIWYSDYHLDFTQIIVNLFFVADLFPAIEWINPIFATLKIEVQFYLLIGLVFPLLLKSRWWLLAFVLLFTGLGVLTREVDTVLNNAPFFCTGITAFFIYRFGWKMEYLILAGILVTILVLHYLPEEFAAAIIGFSLILWLPKTFKLFRFTGKISYSYYLIHGLIGGWFLYFTRESALWLNYSWLMILFALGLSWIGAFVMYQLIEKPCLKWSNKIRYKHSEPNH